MKSFFRRIRHRAIVKNLEIKNDVSILDTSCQDGGFLELLLEKNIGKNFKVSGVDMSELDIIKAQKLIPQGTFSVTDNKTLSFASKTFDVVISSMTLHHMSDPVASLSEMKRVLKEGGNIYLVDIISQNKLLYKIINFLECPEPYHFEKFYSLIEVKSLLSKIGLKIEKENRALVFPSISIVMPVTILTLK